MRKKRSGKRWLQGARKRMEKKGTVGALTRAAKRAGYKSALSYARHILSNKGKYSSTMIKRAQFAVNAAKASRGRKK